MEKHQWNTLPYDAKPVQGAIVEDDIDQNRFRDEYLPLAVSPEVLQENNRDSRQQMQALRLLSRENIPTVAAILVLGKNPIRWLPCAYIQFVRYAGKKITDEVLNAKEIHGTLSDQLRRARDIIDANINIALDTSGLQHVAKPDYPHIALCELVANAVIHKDYWNNEPVRINWFSDKIEVSNAGGLYGEVILEDLKKGTGKTAYRNPTIAEAMKYMGFMKRSGRGVAQIKETLKDNRNPPPKYQVAGNRIMVTIKKEG